MEWKALFISWKAKYCWDIKFPQIYTFDIQTIKILEGFFFSEIENLILKFACKCKGHKIAETVLGGKEDKIGGMILSEFKNCFKATVIKTVALS